VNKVADHIQFCITEVTPKVQKDGGKVAVNKIVEKDISADVQLIAQEPLVSPQIFCQLFPFHLMFNRQMKIVQAGKSVTRVIPKLAEENCNLLDILDAIRPHIQLSFQTILAHISTIYVLKTKPGMMIEIDSFMRLKVDR
jgi:guanylate cyclase soluble subunit beta